MSQKITGIVLNVRKYNDRNCIVTLYTREHGRISMISPLGSGKTGNARRAHLQPLSVICSDINLKPGVELQRLGSISMKEIWNDIYFHPSKRALTLFISEFLYKLLKESVADTPMFDFIIGSIRLLDELKNGVSDFHIPFLVSMLTLSGIRPNLDGQKEGYVFEFASGSFVPEFEARQPFIAGSDVSHIPWVMRLNFSNMKCLRLTAANRRQILYALLNYFSYHFPGLGSLKSPEILREIFD